MDLNSEEEIRVWPISIDSLAREDDEEDRLELRQHTREGDQWTQRT